MRALWLEDQQLQFRDDLPKPATDGEALVRVLLAGICNTDIELTRGYYPFTGIPGHEFVGELEDGTRVVGEINAWCGECDACRDDRRTHCDRRSVLGIVGRNGAFAEYLTLPRRNLHEVPAHVANERAVFAEPLAAALEIQEQIEISTVDRVLVVGDGKLAQLIAQVLALTGCDLLVAGKHERKLSRLESVGIATTTEPLPAKSFDIAVEASGSAAGFDVALSALRARGALVMKSTYAGQLTFNVSALVVDEIAMIGSRCGPMDRAVAMLNDKAIDLDDLVDATYSLEDGVKAFEHAQRPGAMKILVRCH